MLNNVCLPAKNQGDTQKYIFFEYFIYGNNRRTKRLLQLAPCNN